MISTIELVPLSEILIPISRPESVEPEKLYSILGAHWYAGGLYIKDKKPGSEVLADKVYRVEQGDFVYNRLFAWKGSFAVATENDHNCYVSNEFPTFIIDQTRADTQYLLKYFSRSSAWEEALSLSSGGTPTSRNRLKEEKLLAMRIPLPSPEEQRRIVARIEELAGKIEEARGLRQKGAEEAGNIMIITTRSVFRKLERLYDAIRPLKQSATILGGSTPSKANYDFWEGTIPWVSPKDMKTSHIYDTQDHISEAAITSGVSTLIPENSVLVVVRSGILRRTLPVAINRVPVTINQDMKALIPLPGLSSDFLAWWFRGNETDILEDVKGGTTVQSLVWDKVSNFNVCIPPLPEQKRVVAYLDDLQSLADALRHIQTETSAELDALLPSILDKAFKGDL